MPLSQRVRRLEQQVIGLRDLRKVTEFPAEFLREASMLPDDEALELAARLFLRNEFFYIWAAVVIIRKHPTAIKKIGWKYLEPLGNLMDHWGKVDAFAALAGPAWRSGQLSNARVMRWTRSRNRWWRRAALVCTVFLNRKAQGGMGDTPRTIMVCEALAADRDDMVAKGMSWALRDLVAHDRGAVEKFLRRHERSLPALVKREVRSKLTTGRKNPRRSRG